MDIKNYDNDDLTMDEIHDLYKNVIKRFGFIAISTKNGTDKDIFKKEINDIIGKANRKKNFVRDEDNFNDLDIIIKKLKDTNSILDLIKKNSKKNKSY